MDAQTIIENIVERLRQVPSIVGIVLGGSRAKGTHTPKSDIDIGIYYDSDAAFDILSLQHIATEIDDTHRENLLTNIGGWGPWVNGGGWITVQNVPVDFIYRDIKKVSTVIEQCTAGEITIDYHPGHPHGFTNAIYMSEIALCKIVWDPKGMLSDLKAKTAPYPKALKEALINKFLWEASFSLIFANKSMLRQDASHAAGCFFRSVCCLNQALFAINECYWMNETGAVDIADAFRIVPADYKARINEVFTLLSSNPEQIIQAKNVLQKIVEETEQLVGNE